MCLVSNTCLFSDTCSFTGLQYLPVLCLRWGMVASGHFLKGLHLHPCLRKAALDSSGSGPACPPPAPPANKQCSLALHSSMLFPGSCLMCNLCISRVFCRPLARLTLTVSMGIMALQVLCFPGQPATKLNGTSRQVERTVLCIAVLADSWKHAPYVTKEAVTVSAKTGALRPCEL